MHPSARFVEYLYNHCSQNDCFGWGRQETLTDHFKRHGADFGSATEADYARRAQEFRTSALSDLRSEYRLDKDGTL